MPPLKYIVLALFVLHTYIQVCVHVCVCHVCVCMTVCHVCVCMTVCHVCVCMTVSCVRLYGCVSCVRLYGCVYIYVRSSSPPSPSHRMGVLQFTWPLLGTTLALSSTCVSVVAKWTSRTKYGPFLCFRLFVSQYFKLHQNGHTPLHDASKDGHLSLVHVLYAAKCCLDTANCVSIHSFHFGYLVPMPLSFLLGPLFLTRTLIFQRAA